MDVEAHRVAFRGHATTTLVTRQLERGSLWKAVRS